MAEKNDSDTRWQEGQDGHEWHLEFTRMPEIPYPFPIVPLGTCGKHEAVGHLSPDGRMQVFNTGIIEQLVRAGLRHVCRKMEPNQMPGIAGDSDEVRAGTHRH